MGASFRTHPSALEEALDIVRRLLAGETESSSRRFRVTKRGVALRPAEPVEVWIGASAPPAIDRAARLAEGWISSPGLTFEEARAQADFYRERCTAYGCTQRPSRYDGTFTWACRCRGTKGAAAGAGSRLSRHRGRNSDRRIGRGSRGRFRTFAEFGCTEILVRWSA